jgi:hypothetical protein
MTAQSLIRPEPLPFCFLGALRRSTHLLTHASEFRWMRQGPGALSDSSMEGSREP